MEVLDVEFQWYRYFVILELCAKKGKRQSCFSPVLTFYPTVLIYLLADLSVTFSCFATCFVGVSS